MRTIIPSVNQLIDLTVLRPEATLEDIVVLTAQAQAAGTYGVCVSPTFVSAAKDLLANPIHPSTSDVHEVKVVTVVGFPSGTHTAEVKAFEATQAVEAGADEVDMVINLAAALSGEWDTISNEIAAVRAATQGVVLKVILETAVLKPEMITKACRIAEAAGADFVKTSTGMHPAGGATVEAIKLMAAAVGGRLGIKASGGIRTLEQAQELVTAGANRLGMSVLPASGDKTNSPSGY